MTPNEQALIAENEGLKPCPFCGSEAEGPNEQDGAWIIECLDSNCCVAVTAYGPKIEDCIYWWNRRPSGSTGGL